MVQHEPVTFFYMYEIYHKILSPQWQILTCVRLCEPAQAPLTDKQDHALLINPVQLNWRKSAQYVMRPLEHLLGDTGQSCASLPSAI